MKVAGPNNYPISAGGVESPSDFRVNGLTVVQQAKFLRSTYGKCFNRRNLLNSVSFTVSKIWDDAESASQWVLTCNSLVPRSGTFNFTAEGPTGTATRISLVDAVIESIESKQMGCTTFTTYQIIGGRMGTGSVAK